MPIATFDGLHLHYEESGDPDGAPIVFANSLGTDMRLWDAILPLLPAGLRIIRYDKRGHGLSDCPPMPYSMGMLITDAERLMDRLDVRDSLFVGLSIGGMIAQGLSVKRPDLIRAVVLSNTAAKIGTPEIWKDRIDTLKIDGIEALADAVMERWFSAEFRATDEIVKWRHLLCRTPRDGYGGCSAAISGTDFYASTATLRLPALGIAGSEDGSTPPDLMRETMDLIPGSDFALIRGAGHLPCVEKPEEYAGILSDFIRRTGHV
ncbi:3-oxoadipate enol-lactonase [Palleronia sp. LCG004]|uniref:3-oxoadipate enol-lactonase n=1 Tax=Palleronia sp. LCG004 TaxID=3079304 RepID=UPI002941FFAE|nr:3-oxoadipate enol-lactonase [Palleronia sp. LCG004]WOI55780.1 3-oxoadipate enol-lactonase [Palleronia sp. LCG004]